MRFETRYEKVETFGTGHKFIKLKSGRMVSFLDSEREAQDHLSSMWRWGSRMLKLAPDDVDPDDLYWRMLEKFVDQVDAFVQMYRGELEKRLGTHRKAERIAALRNTTGRTPEEAAAFNAKADQLERDL